MSFSFQIKSKQYINYKTLSKELGIDCIEYTNNSIDSEEKITKTTLFIANESVRGVFVEYKDDVYSVKIRIISSEDDIKLAIQTTQCIAKITESLITPEDSAKQFSIEEIDEVYNSTWIDNIKTFGIKQIKEKLGSKTGTFAFWVCYMNYFIGRKIHKKLDATSVESYYYSLLDLIRNTQFFDRSKYVIPKIQTFQDKKTGHVKEVVTFYSHGNQFLTIADTIIFLDLKNNTYSEIPYTMMSKIKNEKIKLIDEFQYIIEELREEDYEKILNSVRKIGNYLNRKNIAIESKTSNKAKEPLAQKESKNVRWWEFWKN